MAPGTRFSDRRHVRSAHITGISISHKRGKNELLATHVAISSGDYLFAEDATRLAALGVWVTVVSRHRSLSQRLAMAACEVIFLDTVDAAAEVA